MIRFRLENEIHRPVYMTTHSAAADLFARKEVVLDSRKVSLVPTGVWIASVDWSQLPAGSVGELQIRARSSLSFKFGLMLANGVGTIDLDYPDEIGVLIYNTNDKPHRLAEGERIGQILLAVHPRLMDASLKTSQRVGGFGSTSPNL